MKKVMGILLISILALAGCDKGGKNSSESGAHGAVSTGLNKTDKIEKVEDKAFLVGISKIISHPALDAVEQGLQDELKEQGFTNIKYDIQSANGEIATAASIANKFKADNVSVAVGIATPTALSLANVLKDTPIVFSAVTDPVDAGLRKSNSVEETSNITGVSDMSPLEEQIKLIAKLVNLKKLGHIYNAGESNSISTLQKLEAYCKLMGIELVTTTVNNTSEVKQATEIMAQKKVNAIYVSTDNVVAAAMGSVTATAAKYKIPVIGADPVVSKNSGALAAYGVEYYKAGRQTGKIVADILRGTKPGNIPVKFMTEGAELELYVDKEVAKKLGIEIPKNFAE